MKKEVEQFFLNLPKDSNYLAMKLLSDVFSRMEESDDTSRKIVQNIEALNCFHIRLLDSHSMANSVYTEDNGVESRIAFSFSAQQMIATHEFGHLLLDLFSEAKLPTNYFEVNQEAVDRLVSKSEEISQTLNTSRDYLFQLLVNSVNELISFIQNHPVVLEEFSKENKNATMEDLLPIAIADYYCFLTNFDERANQINCFGNIIDSSFHGENPFIELYGNDEFFPLIASHDSSYFLEDNDHGKYFAGFEEQFADYLVLKLYRKEMYPTITALQNVIGDDWFFMMDSYYDCLADKVENQCRVYKKENNKS